MTCVTSSTFDGLISTTLKHFAAFSSRHQLIRRSSADKNVSPSAQGDTEWILYSCVSEYSTLEHADISNTY